MHCSGSIKITISFVVASISIHVLNSHSHYPNALHCNNTHFALGAPINLSRGHIHPMEALHACVLCESPPNAVVYPLTPCSLGCLHAIESWVLVSDITLLYMIVGIVR